MTTASTGEIPTHSRDREGDNLTTIKGIGPVRQRWLRESLNVRTFRDLAALSADEIESRLKIEGGIASRSDIEEWIVQAQELAATELPSQRVVESADAEAEATANSPAAGGKWQPFASFVVEFQARQVEGQAEEQRTTVHHMEADKSETWPGIEGERLCQWMLGQLGGKLQQELEEELPVEARLAAARTVAVEITQVQAFQPPDVETPTAASEANQPFSGFVRSDEPFALEVSFELTGPGADDVAKRRTTYSAHFHLRSLTTREKIPLGDTKAAPLDGEAPYTARLSQTSLQPGLYRLRALVTLQSTPPRKGYLEVPLLQVV